MPLPLLAVAAIGAAGVGASIWGQSNTNKANKKMLRLQKEADARASASRGSQLFNADQALAGYDYDDDPFTSNQRTLYATGGTPTPTKGGGTGGLDAGFSIANNLVGMWSTHSNNKNAVAQAQFEANKIIPGSIDQVTAVAQKDADNKAKRFANPYTYKPEDTELFAKGGIANVANPLDQMFQGVNKQSSNTAVVNAGTHESGNDLEFANPNGSKAKIEGGEGMKTAPNGSVNIYSDRIPVPGENVSIADKFSHLSSLKGNLEKDMKGASNAITKNTIDRKIIGIDATMDELFKVQENVKRAAEYQAQSLSANNEEVPAIPSAPDQLFANGGTSKFGVNRGQSEVPIPKDVILHAGDDVNNTEEAAKKAEESKGHTDYDPKKIVVMNRMTPFGTKNFGKNQTQLAAAYNGIDTKKLATPYVDPNAEDGKGNNTFWNTIKSDDGINGIATGLTLLDNLYNARQIKNIDIKDPHYVNKVELDKEYDTTAAEYGVKKELDNFYKNVDKNTTSSIVGLNMKLSAMAEGIDKLNGVYDTKQKYEGEMHNREILANSNIEAQNVGIYNGDKDKQSVMNANIAMQKSANFSNAIDDTVNGLLRYQGMRTDRDRFAALENSTAATGVQIGNLKAGLYKDLDASSIEAGLDKSIGNGNMSYKDYVSGLEFHNKGAKVGSVVKPMTKAQFDAKFGKLASKK